MGISASKKQLRQAIRQYCIECSGGSMKNVRDCSMADCPLWPFRFGKPGKEAELLESLKEGDE